MSDQLEPPGVPAEVERVARLIHKSAHDLRHGDHKRRCSAESCWASLLGIDRATYYAMARAVIADRPVRELTT